MEIQDRLYLHARRGSNILSVRSFRGLDAGSDYFLVRATVSKKNLWSDKCKVPKWNIFALKDPDKGREYHESLKIILGSIQNDENIECIWRT